MSYTDATDQVLAVLDDFKIAAFENDEQYEALANAIRKAIAMHVRPGMADPLQDPGVQGLAQLGRNAIERVAQLEAELAGYVEANRYMKGELDDALEDARKYCEAQGEIARLRDRLDAALSQSSLFGDALHAIINRCEGMANRIARAALAQVAEVPNG